MKRFGFILVGVWVVLLVYTLVLVLLYGRRHAQVFCYEVDNGDGW